MPVVREGHVDEKTAGAHYDAPHDTETIYQALKKCLELFVDLRCKLTGTVLHRTLVMIFSRVLEEVSDPTQSQVCAAGGLEGR